MKLLVTGGAGFIGSAVVRRAIAAGHAVVNVDKLTYSGNLANLASVAGDQAYAFEQVDICDADALREVFALHQPDAVMHLAAESHVDRSIDGPMAFVQTNVVGTAVLLEVARGYWSAVIGRRVCWRNRANEGIRPWTSATPRRISTTPATIDQATGSSSRSQPRATPTGGMR